MIRIKLKTLFKCQENNMLKSMFFLRIFALDRDLSDFTAKVVKLRTGLMLARNFLFEKISEGHAYFL